MAETWTCVCGTVVTYDHPDGPWCTNCDRKRYESHRERDRRRFEAAKAVMQALAGAIAKMDDIGIITNRPRDVAEISCVYADALLDELAKGKSDE